MPSSAHRSLENYVNHLLKGHRLDCRRIFDSVLPDCDSPVELFTDLLWPAMERVQKLYRADQINMAVEHLATRINRQLADQVRQHLDFPEPNGRKVVMACAENEPEELGAQMTADLFEANGWEVFFLGGGVPNDEIMALCGRISPNILLIFGTTPHGVPGIRKLIDSMREIGVCSSMNVLISGGVFNRADGLWEEVNADLFAPDATQALDIANDAKQRQAPPVTPGAPKKRRRRRRSPYLETAAV